MDLNDFIMRNEVSIRLGCFIGVFGIMALWEIISPRRRLQTSRAIRWANNLGLVFFNSVVLRLVVVTPDMHRVHHSAEDDETNSNFGFNLPCWDRLFGTYRALPRDGHEAMTIGIRTFSEDKWYSWLPGMLAIPFVGKVQDYATNRRQWERTHEQ